MLPHYHCMKLTKHNLEAIVANTPLRYTLIMTSSPSLTESHRTGQQLASSILSNGDIIDRIFFYQDASFVGLKSQVPGQGLLPTHERWLDLKNTHSIPLQICIANALRRGVIDNTEANRYDQLETMTSGFELTGLGEMAEACQSSDRIITL